MISQPNGTKADSENTGFGYREFTRYDVSGLTNDHGRFSHRTATEPVAKYLPRVLGRGPRSRPTASMTCRTGSGWTRGRNSRK